MARDEGLLVSLAGTWCAVSRVIAAERFDMIYCGMDATSGVGSL